MTVSMKLIPLMNSKKLLKVMEYLLSSHLENHLKIDHRRYRCGNITGCLDVITLVKETVAYYN